MIDKNSKLRFCSVFASFALTLISTAANADEAYYPVEFEHTPPMLRDYTYDTGWIPNSTAPIRVRFFFHAGGGLEAQLPGDAVLSWPDGYFLSYTGEEDGGKLELDVGVYTMSRVAWDLPFPIGSGEAPIPYMPQTDLLFFDQAFFTPFLLKDSEDTPVSVKDDIPKNQLAFIDLVPIITGGTPVPGFKAGLKIFASGKFKGFLRGDQITTIPEQGGKIIHKVEGQALPWPASGQSHQEGMAAYHATTYMKGDIIITPAISAELGDPTFWTWTLAPVDVPVPVIDGDYQWKFTRVPIEFNVPIPEDDTDTETETETETIVNTDAGVDTDRDTDSIADSDSDTGQEDTAVEDETDDETEDDNMEGESESKDSCSCATPGRVFISLPGLITLIFN